MVMKALAKTPADRFADAGEFLAALERSRVPEASPTQVVRPVARKRSWIPVAAVLGLAAAASSGWLLFRRDALEVPPAAEVIAVLPPRAVTSDTLLERLGRDLAVTVSANLDGVGGIRTLDPQTVLSQAAVGSSGPAEDLRIGRRFGAGSVLRGMLRREGNKVRLELRLVVSDTSRSDSAGTLARVSVAGSLDSVAALTDSITWNLLRAIWRRGTPPSPSLDVALRTRSVRALSAFLRGEQYLVENRWIDAAQAYLEATAEDSTFWLAYWRAGFARSWLQHGAEDTTLARTYWARRAELPERERLMIELGRADSLSAQLALGRRVTNEYPDSWLGWLLYADALVHGGPLVGRTRAEAREALSAAIGRKPGLIAAWDHGTWMALQDGDTLWSGYALQTLQDLNAGPALYEEYGEDELRELRLLDRVRRGDTLAASSLVDSIVNNGGSSLTPAAPFWYGFFSTQILLSRGELRRVADGPAVPFHLAMIALSFAGRGAWDSALVAIDRYAGSDVSPTGAQAAYRLAVTGVWLGALDAAAARSRRPAAERDLRTLGPDAQAELLWLDGVLAASSSDRAALANAREGLRAFRRSGTEVAERSLAAFELAAAGQREEAGRALARLEWSRAERWNRGELRNQALLPIDRLAAATWLLEAGDTLTAARLLRWHEAYSGSLWTAMLMPIAYLRRAEIEERQGRLPVAARYYREFLLRYDLPTVRTQPLVQRAASALARLG
jgi:TolB-like protein